jgi:hypothetical protein
MVFLKQRAGTAATLTPMESRVLVSRSLYRRLTMYLSQPFMLTLTKISGALRAFDLGVLKVAFLGMFAVVVGFAVV